MSTDKLKRCIGPTLAHMVEVTVAIVVALAAITYATHVLGVGLPDDFWGMAKLFGGALIAPAAPKLYRQLTGNDYVNQQ